MTADERPVTPARVALAGLVAAAAVAWLAWPLPREASRALVDPMTLGVPGGLWGRVDLDLVVWILAWGAHALVTDPARLFQANIFYPAPDALASSEHLLGLAPLAAPAYLATGNAVLAHNLTVLAVVWIAALACWALARAWTGDGAAGALAAAAFALAPANVLGFTRLHVSAAHLVPVVLLLAWRAARAPGAATVVLLAVATALQALSGFYVAYALAAALVAFAPALWLEARAGGGRRVAAAVGAGFALAVPAALPYLRARAAGVVAPDDGVSAAAALVVPPGTVAAGVVASLGWPIAALAVVGLVAGRASRAVRLGLALVAVAGFLLALGPTLPLLPGTTLPGPYAIAMRLVPGFASLRSPTRFVVLPALAGALLAAAAAAALADGARRRFGAAAARGVRLAVVALAAALVVARAGAVPTTRVAFADPEWAADRWLAAHGEGRPAVSLPLHLSGLDGPALLATGRTLLGATLHWTPLVNGYSGYAPPSYDLLATIARRLPDPGSLADLCALVDLGWIVVHRRALGADAAAWDGIEMRSPLRIAWTDGDAVVHRVPPGCGAREAALRAAIVAEDAERTLGGVSRAPLPDGARRARLDGALPDAAPAGLWTAFRVQVTNTGDAPWPGLAVRLPGTVVLRVRWLAPATGTVALEAAPARLAADLAPGETLHARVGTPVPAAGDYVLEIAVAQAGVGPFPADAAPPLRAPVRTRPWGTR